MLRRKKKELASFKNSVLSPHIPTKVVGYIERLLRGDDKDNYKAILASYYIRYHTRGFDIVDVKIALNKRNKVVVNVINKALEQTYPGSRHHIDDNPTIYAFLALVHNKLGRIVRNKLGLDYAAFDRGNKTISISITEPAVEEPPAEDTEALDQEMGLAADENPQDNMEMQPPMPAPGGDPGMGGMGMGGGMDDMGMGGMGGMGGMDDMGMGGMGNEQETATPVGGPVPGAEEQPPESVQGEENVDDDIANIAQNLEF